MFKIKKTYLFFSAVFFIISFLFGFISSAEQKENSSAGKIIEIEINGTINPSTTDYIKDGLDIAKAENAQALLILLDTPGGLLTSTKDIVKLILNSEIPVIVYVYPKGASATSAGVFITLSAHIAAMSPGTSIGAAHPVSIGQKPKSPTDSPTDNKSKDNKETSDKQKDIMGEKIENYASSFIESIAEERGRNVRWAEDAVRNSASITANEALKKNVVDMISSSKESLLSEIDGKKIKLNEKEKILVTKSSTIERHEMSLKQRILNVLSTPDIAFLLLSLGSLGILVEFYNPGAIFPGVAGLISLLIGFISLQILPFNYGGLILLFLGIALFIAEAYVSSYGLLALGGAICFVLGALLLFDTQGSDISVGYGIIAATVGAFGIFFILVVFFLNRSYGLPVQGGFEGLLGEKGEVISWGNNEGKVFVHGEYWNATSEEFLSPGDKVEVMESKGDLEIKVKKK